MASDMPVDIYNTPAAHPPPGQTSNLNLKNPYNTHKIILMTGILCLSATTIVVSLRIFTKVHILKQVRLEDYLLIVTQLGFIPWVVLIMVTPGSGRHLWDVSIYNATQFAKYDNIVLAIYSPLTFFVKFSILLQLQHIFVTSHRQPVFFIIQALIWANFTYYIALFFLQVFACVPRRKIWDQTVPGKCVSLTVRLIGPGGINILSDIFILMIPTIMVFRLQMALKSKLATIAVFGSGLFTLISSIARLVYSIKVLHSTDILYNGYSIGLWAVAEIATIILATTFPTMPRLWKYIRTGDRNGQRYASSERRSTPFSTHRPRQPVKVENSPRSDVLPLKGRYQELQDGRKSRRQEEVEMQIMKTETYEVTSQLKDLPEVP